jgi:hypothetical protein
MDEIIGHLRSITRARKTTFAILTNRDEGRVELLIEHDDPPSGDQEDFDEYFTVGAQWRVTGKWRVKPPTYRRPGYADQWFVAKDLELVSTQKFEWEWTRREGHAGHWGSPQVARLVP